MPKLVRSNKFFPRKFFADEAIRGRKRTRVGVGGGIQNTPLNKTQIVMVTMSLALDLFPLHNLHSLQVLS